MGAGNPNAYENLNGANLPTVFTPERQPDSEARKRGWLKRKRGRDMVKAMLEIDIPYSEAKQIVSDFFGIHPEEINVEVMVHAVQIAKAIQKGDTFAYAQIMERAYGKPKDLDPEEDREAPAIIIQPLAAHEAPPIVESEGGEEGLENVPT